ncbi:cell division protein FtsQ/DivIB [Gordonia zhaorongruii]|uniref:cell division protein FtsQ/DivIB n=1 Tax=Gordonia zhaorongruii TaxID=2597659 RepID=UPI001F3A085A|nr:FtsQ-type POTRA domain-containing protein [Gordonia zhaorongruii]
MSRGSTARRPGRLSVVLAMLGLVALVGGAVAVAYYSPLMSVRSVEVTGATAVDENRVRELAQAPSGMPLLQVDTGAIANRIAVLPAVEEVRVERSYPSALTIEVTERVPVVLVEQDGKLGVMDRIGVVYATYADRKALPKEFAALPELTTPNPGPRDPTTEAVITTVQGLPDWLATKVVAADAASPSDIVLTLKSGRRAVWGGEDRSDDKAATLAQLLKMPGREFNVSSPEFPAVN